MIDLIRNQRIYTVLFVFVAAFAKECMAGDAIEQQQQQIQNQRNQQVEQYKNAVRQQQQAAQQAAQQQVYLKQRALQQRQAYQSAIKQKVAQQQSYQQALQQRSFQQQRAYQQAMQGEGLRQQQEAYQQALRDKQSVLNEQYSSSVPRQNTSESPQVDDVVNIEDIWQELEVSSEVWDLMIDQEPKRATVEHYIEIYREEGTQIRKSADYYVQMIDQMVIDNSDILQNPFKNILGIVAVVEYDFDNGQDKDVLARKILGEEGYWKNRERLGF